MLKSTGKCFCTQPGIVMRSAAFLWGVIICIFQVPGTTTRGSEPAPERVTQSARPAHSVPVADDINAWIADLSHPEFSRREKATSSLRRAGKAAVAPLTVAVASQDLEVAHRALMVIASLANSSDAELANTACTTLMRLARAKRSNTSRSAQKHVRKVMTRHIQALGRMGARYDVDDAGVVRSVRLHREIATDKSLRQIAAISSLNTVDINCAQLDAKALTSLRQLPELQRLILGWSSITDAHLGEVIQISTLKHLDLEGTKISDVGVRKLVNLSKLEHLSLRFTDITGESLNDLQACRNLKRLYLDGSLVTDKTIVHVRHLKNLESLMCGGGKRPDGRGVPLTDKGLTAIAGLSNLRFLSVAGTNLTDRGLRELTKLKKLEKLWVGASLLTDASMKDIARLPALQNLSLAGTGVTDEGIQALRSIGTLKHLFLENTKVTDTGALRFRESRPDCEVVLRIE